MTAEPIHFRAALRRIANLAATDPQVKEARVTAADIAAIRDRGSAIETIEAACRQFASRPCLAARDDVAAAYASITYAELWRRVVATAGGLREHVQPGELVAICGPGSINWVVADLACLYLGAVSVPIQTTAVDAELAHILGEARPVAVFAAASHRAAIERVLPVRMFSLEEDLAGPELPYARPSELFSIVYTSGSTGLPKGVMLPEARWQRTLREPLATTPLPTITIGYLPLAHMAGRISLYTTLVGGGTTHFVTRADMSSLFEDIRAVRPTALTLVPRIAMIIHQHFQTEVVRRGAAEQEVMAEMRRTFLGDRLCFLTTGAAPTPPEVVSFLEVCFEAYVVDTYGSTELGRIAINGRVQPTVEYKLVDVPELGYTRADQPYPRGELAVKSLQQTPGYYERSESIRDADGFILSGDIVEERGPGNIAWIDRKLAVLRLANGEFVNVSRIEDVVTTESPFIEQIYVHGDPRRAYVLAIVVPNREAVTAELERRGCSVEQLLRAELDRMQLRGHEVPRAFVVEWEPFTVANGFLTESNKPRRAALKEHFAEQLEALYREVEARHLPRVSASGDDAGTVADRVRRAVAMTLGRDLLGGTFVQLGGDSLSAVRLATLIREACGVDVPVATILDPRATIEVLIAEVERGAGPTTFSVVHGVGSRWAWARDLRLDRIVPGLATDLAPARPPREILLTGATGFLGRFILLELLERADHVHCLVRDESLARIRAGYATEAMRRRFDELAPKLIVVTGDLARPGLGVTDVVRARLATTIDAIVHAGALVNHVFSYEQLFAPNVLGTAAIIELALTERRKAIHFVSTIGVAARVRRHASVRESEQARTLWTRRVIETSDYAGGYGTSKWAAELLLDQARERGCPVTISRCSMILPHREHAEELNPGDSFTRLLFGLARTGCAPESFYADSAAHHYDGLPVDVVARVIAALPFRADAGGIYHVSNASASLDAIAEWTGFALERLPYAAWFETFRQRLEALPEAERRRSPLAIVERWSRSGTIDDEIALETTRFRGLLDDVPELTEAYIARCARAIGRP